jgi:hypothetical protein
MTNFSSFLPSMRGLKKLSMKCLSHEMTQEFANYFLVCLKRNMELETVTVTTHHPSCGFYSKSLAEAIGARIPSQIGPEFRYLTKLNRGGRRILQSDDNTTPLGLWPLVLARSSGELDVLNYFLHEKNNLLIPARSKSRISHKRKQVPYPD